MYGEVCLKWCTQSSSDCYCKSNTRSTVTFLHTVKNLFHKIFYSEQMLNVHLRCLCSLYFIFGPLRSANVF